MHKLFFFSNINSNEHFQKFLSIFLLILRSQFPSCFCNCFAWSHVQHCLITSRSLAKIVMLIFSFHDASILLAVYQVKLSTQFIHYTSHDYQYKRIPATWSKLESVFDLEENPFFSHLHALHQNFQVIVADLVLVRYSRPAGVLSMNFQSSGVRAFEILLSVSVCDNK